MALVILKSILFIIYIYTFINFINIIVKETNYDKGINRIVSNLSIGGISIVGLYIVEYYI